MKKDNPLPDSNISRRNLLRYGAAGTTGAALLSSTLAEGASAQTQKTGADGYEPIPDLPKNACHNSSLPRSYGTAFPTPDDPYGYGFANETAIGWEGNWYPPIAYISGAYFARGVPAQYKRGGQTLCGGMYSFGVYTYGLDDDQQPESDSISWEMAESYLPAMITSFSRNNVSISITNFADRATINGNPVELVYTRVAVTNNQSTATTVPPDAKGPNLVKLGDSPEKVQAGATVQHDFVAAVDTFGSGEQLPTPSQIKSSARDYQVAYENMKEFWNNRLDSTPNFDLPNVKLPDTGLENPGTAMEDAYKASFVYTRIFQAGKAQFSAADNYAWLLNHDLPGILVNRFTQGDFKDARNLLLTSRVSENPEFDEKGANWYWDGVWKTPWAWAIYLEKTDDTEFVSKYFHDDVNDDSPWGPSLYTMMHDLLMSQLNEQGYLKPSIDNDSQGTWLFDDYSALIGLQSYRYIAERIGKPSEAKWAATQYSKLLDAVNEALKKNETTNDFNWLPCEVDQANSSNRCGNAKDANWVSPGQYGQNAWDLFLTGGKMHGILGDPTQTNNLYQMGYARLDGVLPYPTMGGYSGYSTANNTDYAEGALYGNRYRDLPLVSYAWQIANTTGGPNAWWESNGSPPNPDNPWKGTHDSPQFGAVPYAWPLAGQGLALTRSIVAEGLTDTSKESGHHDHGHHNHQHGNNSHGNREHSSSFDRVLYIGRGIPDDWIVPGQSLSVRNLTWSSSIDSDSDGHHDHGHHDHGHHGQCDMYGVRIKVRKNRGDRIVQVNILEGVPTDNVKVQLPSFASAGVKNVKGGTYDTTTHTVTMRAGHPTVQVRLGHASQPKLTAHVDSTVSGEHTHPILTGGKQTTLSTTLTNPGKTTIHDVKLTLQLPKGWDSRSTSSTNFTSVAPGKTKNATWSITPADNANGSYFPRVSATYSASHGAGNSTNTVEYVRLQRSLPLPPGTTDIALKGTPSASHTSPWEDLSAINDGIYPSQSNDNQNPRWGTWPQQGTQWIQLKWEHSITADGSKVYFFADGGGVRLPASWKVQYWNGNKFVDVENPSGYPTKLDTFNEVNFDPVTTTQLRVVMESGKGSVGALEWLVYNTN